MANSIKTIKKIIKTEQGSIIARNCGLCTTKMSQAIGLMFGIQSTPLVFDLGKEQDVYLHMVFVFKPIDVVLLDENKNVVEVLENFGPFTQHRFKKKARYVLELENGAIGKYHIKLNDNLFLNSLLQT